MSALWGWGVAFFFTQLFEVPLYWRASRSWRTSLLASALTHPIVWFVFPLLMDVGVDYVPMVVLAELFAIAVEAAWLRWNGVPHPLLWSLGANTLSVTCGFVLRALVGFP